MQYLIKAKVEYGGMSPNYVHCGGLEAYKRDMTDKFSGVKMGKRRHFLEAINTITH